MLNTGHILQYLITQPKVSIPEAIDVFCKSVPTPSNAKSEKGGTWYEALFCYVQLCDMNKYKTDFLFNNNR